MRFCEMKKSNFTVGQTVYLQAINDNARYLKDDKTKIEKGIVSKIGSRYITVDIRNSSYQFDITNHFYGKTNIGSPDWKLLLNVEQIEEEKEAEELTQKMKSALSGYSHDYCELSLSKLRRICKIIDE